MVNSMTGFAARRGGVAGGVAGGGAEWAWDLRGVNGKGFDLRHRGVDGLEPLVRAQIGHPWRAAMSA